MKSIRNSGLLVPAVALAIAALAFGVACRLRWVRRPPTVNDVSVRNGGEGDDVVTPLGDAFEERRVTSEWNRPVEPARQTQIEQPVEKTPPVQMSERTSVDTSVCETVRLSAPVLQEKPSDAGSLPEITVELADGNGTLKGRLYAETPQSLTLEFREGVRVIVPKTQLRRRMCYDKVSPAW